MTTMSNENDETMDISTEGTEVQSPKNSKNKIPPEEQMDVEENSGTVNNRQSENEDPIETIESGNQGEELPSENLESKPTNIDDNSKNTNDIITSEDLLKETREMTKNIDRNESVEENSRLSSEDDKNIESDTKENENKKNDDTNANSVENCGSDDVNMDCTENDVSITTKTGTNENVSEETGDIDKDKTIDGSTGNINETETSNTDKDVEIDDTNKTTDDQMDKTSEEHLETTNKLSDIDEETNDKLEKTGDNAVNDNCETAEETNDKHDEIVEETDAVAQKNDETTTEKDSCADKMEESSEKADETAKETDVTDNMDKTDSATDMNDDTVDKNQDVAENNDNAADKNKETTQKDDEVTDKNQDVAENNDNAADKNKDATQKDDEVTDKSPGIADKDQNGETNASDITSRESASIMEVDVPALSSETGDKDPIVNDSDMNDENSIFVQVNNDKDDSEKSMSIDQGSNDVDPIGSSEWSQNSEPSFVSELDEADECIIPDANRDEPTENAKEPESIQTTTSVAPTPNESDSMKLSEKYLVSIAGGDDENTCMICNESKSCKYNCSKDNNKTNICSEDCLGKLKEQHPENVIVRQLRVKSFSLDKSLQRASGLDIGDTSRRTIYCVNCRSPVSNLKNSLSWEALDFCDEQCLTKHQKVIGSHCANCKIEVKENFLGKYCVRFGYNVRQFCSSTCLEEYKKSSKVCSYCQDDISGNTSGFLTSIGDKGLSKDFCSAQCMQKYNEINKHIKGTKTTDECCVCHKNKQVEIEFDFKSKNNQFCSDPCFVAFKYVNDVSAEKCDMCSKYFTPIALNQPYLMRYDGIIRKFCLKTCQNIYITTNRKIVSCCWCKVKKYNFDMIQKYVPEATVLIVCSLTCLNFFNASVNATKMKKKRCDFCNKICKGQYHITLADDTMKNFCSYPCVQEYQSKYLVAPARYGEQPIAVPVTPPSTRVTTRKASSAQLRKQVIPDVPGPLPIITSVRSLAPVVTQNTRSLRSKTSSAPPSITTVTTLQSEPAGPPPVRRVVVLRPPDMPLQRNVATLVKPITCDVGVEFKPVMIDKAVQTEDIKDSLVLVPIPVPIYVPSPMRMFELTHPIPIPFPLPIPIPMFVPVTKQTAGIVLKDLKKNQVRTPTDPYEADLLMMAELVAGEAEKIEKKEPVDHESDAESDGGDVQGADTYSPEPPDASNTFGDDMLQMALKMATDFEEPAVDLEGALTASTITATAATNEPIDDVQPVQRPVERTTFRGRRRGRPPRHGGRGRGRGRPPTQPQTIVPTEPEPEQPTEPVEKPDANMCLKYTFGVNAWKQWVTTKNAELEKSSRRPQLFKADLLQLTSDELNYSLCLFVKEVRKPNGAEYAPDTIYYLCLGIQQYLYENQRIDNIFCDSYYESFTDCLDEVCKKFSSLYNDSQYIVTRVEEEHLWESKQLGAHSPHVLLSTLMFFNTKHFNLTNVEEHMQLSFSHIMKHWKRVPCSGVPKNSTSRNILLRFYPPQSAIEGNNRKKKVYEQQENEDNPLRCPVKLYEFYLSKCPESVKTRNDVFYLLPERSCVPDSPVWYSTMALGKDALEKMLHRVKMVKEINVALLAS